MPAYSLQDFKLGLDLRKSYVTAPAGSLRTMRNCFISAGAEIEKRTAFMLYGPATAGSIGIVSRGNVVYVVKNGASGITFPSGTPPTAAPGVISLPFPGGITIDRISDWDLFNGLFYIVLHGTNGLYYHYYNQILVTDAMATSSSIRTYGGKMYGVDGKLLRFSKINDPTVWTPPIPPVTNDGTGYIDLSAQDPTRPTSSGWKPIYGQLAIFSSLSTQLWTVASDPSQNKFNQLLRSTGMLATNGITQYGNGDVLYLSSHGIRSLRVQNISLTAGITDVGTPIDELFRQLLITNGPSWFVSARCLIQPRSARVFVVLPDRIHVLSTFQEPAITAWPSFDAPFGFVDSCVADPWVVLRGSDNNIYTYGSDVSTVYDATQAEVITPALSCESPRKTKLFHWLRRRRGRDLDNGVGGDPNNQATEETVATFTGATYMDQSMDMPGQTTHVSLRFRSTDASRARLAM